MEARWCEVVPRGEASIWSSSLKRREGHLGMNINTPLLSVEEMEALRADLQQPKSREAEPVDLASGDHALRRVVPIIERRLELFQSAVELIVARSIRETLTPLSHPPDVIGPRTATGTMRELSMVIEIHTPEFGLVGFVGVEKLLSFLLVERPLELN